MKVKINDAYTVFAKYYDEIMEPVPYDEWVEYLEALLTEMNIKPERILDLGCGTGNIALRLARRGFQVMGIDGSEAMIEVARQKALEKELPAEFWQGDFRTFRVEEPFPLVISLYDSLNYLLTEEDLAQAFKQVYEAVQPGGFFIFDMNTIKRLTTIEEGNSMVDGEDYFFFWKDSLDPSGPYWNVQLTIFVNQPNGTMYREDEAHTERAYPVARITELLQEAGFAVERLYDAYTQDPGSEESLRIFVVARRVV